MELTTAGLFLIPFGLALALLRSPLPLLFLLIFFAPFTGTAVINFSSPEFGIQPGYFFAILLMARLGWNLLRGRSVELGRSETGVAVPLLLLLAAGVLSISLIPLYAPDILVTRPSGFLERLVVTRENLTQLIYLVFIVLLTITISVTRLDPGQLRIAVRVLVVSGVCVALWGWLQVGLDAVGLAYPDTLFNNNASFSQLFAQRVPLVGIKRMTSVAPEPSVLARSLLVPLSIVLHSATVGGTDIVGRRTAILISAFLGVTLIMTTSSTAILGLFAVAGLFVLFHVYLRRAGHPGLDASGLIPVLIFVPAAVMLIAVVGLGITLDQMRLALDVLLFGKLESVSGLGRLAGAVAALDLFVTHPLFGVGWGSNRSFDLLTNVLSNIGLVGFVLLVWVHTAVLVPSVRAARRLREHGGALSPAVLEGTVLALLALLAGKLLAEPEITHLDHWILVGLLAASLRYCVPSETVRP